MFSFILDYRQIFMPVTKKKNLKLSWCLLGFLIAFAQRSSGFASLWYADCRIIVETSGKHLSLKGLGRSVVERQCAATGDIIGFWLIMQSLGLAAMEDEMNWLHDDGTKKIKSLSWDSWYVFLFKMKIIYQCK